MTVALSFTGFVFGMQQTRREAAGRRGARAGLDGLGVLEARLAQMHVHVDEAGRDDQARGVEHLGAGASRFSTRLPAIDAVLNEHIGDSDRTASAGIDHAAVPDQEASHGYCSILSSTAMRTAMPFSTWFRITERWESATSR